MKQKLLPLLLLPAAFCLNAAELTLDVEIPALDVAEYHRPYVAVWIEREDASVAANLAVWYQQDERAGKNGDAKGESGTKWLPDLRQWWRRSGRAMTLPVDGVTGATRPVGSHTLRFGSDAGPLKELAPGSYKLVVEAAREVGGRELLKLPLVWPPTQAVQASAQGSSELGRIALDLTP